MTASINVTTIIRSANTQFRMDMDEDNVIALIDLIERGVQFKTPIKLASLNDRLYLVDGFHRVEAYFRAGIEDIPANQYEVVQASSIEEVRLMARGANVAHGKSTTEADYYLIIKDMLALEDGKYKKNAFEADVKKIASAIGAALPKVRRGYSDYYPNGGQSLSQQCTAKRDAAIMEQHGKGLSTRKIAEMFWKADDVESARKTVGNVIKELLGKITDSAKFPTAENTSIPLASTERGADTLDPNGIGLSDLSHIIDKVGTEAGDVGDFTLDGNWTEFDDCPFSLTEDAGFTAEQPVHTKAEPVEPVAPAMPSDYELVQKAKASPSVFQENYLKHIEKVEFLCKQGATNASNPSRLDTIIKSLTEATTAMHRDQRIAAQAGIALPE